MTPTVKAAAIDGLLTSLAGISRRDAGISGVCVWCKQPVGDFRDDLSQREHHISGFCQRCQDDTFGGEDE